MSNILELASASNFAHNTGKTSDSIKFLTELYQTVQRGGGKDLLYLDINDCQCVGLAFANMSIFYNWGDEDISSVAAENAFYCLAKSYIDTENSFVIPAIFTMLMYRPSLLNDKFIANWCDIVQKKIGIPIGVMLSGNPFRDPQLQDFRDQAVVFMKHVQYYTLDIFYDIKNANYKIPTDIPLLTPKQPVIDQFLLHTKKSQDFEHTKYLNEGKTHFEGVYKQCEDTLKKI